MTRESKRPINLKMARRLTEIRQYRGLRQIDVAKFVKVTKGTVCNWEHGRTGIGAARLPQLAAVLQCTVADLLAAPGSPIPRAQPLGHVVLTIYPPRDKHP
jgi:transcriptional regulator with XRE-family HTH domain